MDPAVAEGHFVLGMIGWAQGRMRTAFDELRLALSLNPSDTDSMSYLAEIACYVGKPMTSGPLVERLLEIDPLASNTYVASVFHHVYNGRFDAALEPARTAFRLDPESHRTRFAYFLACMSAGRSAESAPMVERWRREAPDHSWPELVNAWLAAERGEEIAISRRTLEVAWMDLSAAGHGLPTAYAMLGRTDEALRWLTRGVELGFINYPFLAHLEPRFESLRSDERFQALMVPVKRQWEAFEV
jgi:tetratricopeptide (TPR) repeat protein